MPGRREGWASENLAWEGRRECSGWWPGRFLRPLSRRRFAAEARRLARSLGRDRDGERPAPRWPGINHPIPEFHNFNAVDFGSGGRDTTRAMIDDAEASGRPRPRLDREQIVRAACAIGEREGAPAV